MIIKECKYLVLLYEALIRGGEDYASCIERNTHDAIAYSQAQQKSAKAVEPFHDRNESQYLINEEYEDHQNDVGRKECK